MAYSAQVINKQETSGGVECTVLLTDSDHVYPDTRNPLWLPGAVLTDLTDEFLQPYIDEFIARAIQDTILSQAQDRYTALLQSRFQQDIASGLSRFLTNVNNRLALHNLDPTSLATLIANQWAAYGVDGVLNVPTIRLVVDDPPLVDHEILGQN